MRTAGVDVSQQEILKCQKKKKLWEETQECLPQSSNSKILFWSRMFYTSDNNVVVLYRILKMLGYKAGFSTDL